MSSSLRYRQKDLEYLQRIAADFSVEKDPEKAAQCRERGNTCFKSRDYTAAARHYSMVCQCFSLDSYDSKKRLLASNCNVNYSIIVLPLDLLAQNLKSMRFTEPSAISISAGSRLYINYERFVSSIVFHASLSFRVDMMSMSE